MLCLLRIDKVREKEKIVRNVYYETIKRDLNKRLIYECRYSERLENKPEKSWIPFSIFVFIIKRESES
jgi:hypothetical protein